MNKKVNRFRMLMFFCFFILPYVIWGAEKAPSGLHFLCESPYNRITLFWTDNSSTESGYHLSSRVPGGAWQRVADIYTQDVTSYSIESYNRESTQEFRVRCFNGADISSWSNIVKVTGLGESLVVYPEIPGIRNPQTYTKNGITFSELQDQCPAEPGKGKAARISTFYNIQVRPSSGGDWLSSPTYEVRPQIRDQLPQNDPIHSNGGHSVYAYGKYGPNSNVPGRTLHSRHWNNFDAKTEVTVRITLLAGALSSSIRLDQTEIYPAPIAVNQVSSNTLDITLPAAGTGSIEHARHYMIAFNRTDWEDTDRGPLVYEHPLMIFINPVKPAPASAPEDTFKEFNGGKLLVLGPGIHLPDNHLRFFGAGENNTAEEVYIPGDAYLHGGFVLNNTTHPVRVWGRGIYSDEMFLVHNEDYNWSARTPWATLYPCSGNTWNITGSWEASLFLKGNQSYAQTFEGLTSISRRMGSVTERGGNGRLIDHKDTGYAGGLYQKTDSKTYYLGIFTVNDDDITYCHEDYEMHYSTSRNFHNGPSFQFGWAVNNMSDARGKVYNHTILPADKTGTGIGENHGVFNSRLQSGNLLRHMGGYYENFKITGQENIVFNIGISANADRITGSNPVSVFSDKTFRNFTIEKHSRSDNKLETAVLGGTNWKSYMRFIHFDNLVIEGNKVDSIDDGDFFDYGEGLLKHTVTFFSLPNKIKAPSPGNAPVGQTIDIFSPYNNKYIRADYSLPVSLGPLCANSSSAGPGFKVVDAGGGYIALKASNGYYVKADPQRYGYVYTEPDALRQEMDTKEITEEAKFIWVDLGGNRFALYSKAMQLHVRVEPNCGPEMPLYGATGSIGEKATFTTSAISAATPTPTPTPQIPKGDVNGDGTINIVDALMTAQYYVGLNPTGFKRTNADVNCSGAIDIIDALVLAQYYVGLVNNFC